MRSIRIVPANAENIRHINAVNEPFEVTGRLVPAFDGARWTFSEELFDEPYAKSYPEDDEDWARYLEQDGRAILLAFDGDDCVGRIRLRRDWNRYAFVEDIAVRAAWRGKGVGTALIAAAKAWAQERGLMGLALETQDMNLSACRFYRKLGFEIGGVNTMLYRNFKQPYCDETAIFWYLKFD